MSGPGNAWRGIIGGLRGKEHLYDKMPPPGGFTQANPAAVFSSAGHAVEVVYGSKGKKKIKRVSTAKEEERQLSLEEAMENPNKMFKYLKQYNKRKDRRWEEAELAAYQDEDDIM